MPQRDDFLVRGRVGRSEKAIPMPIKRDPFVLLLEMCVHGRRAGSAVIEDTSNQVQRGAVLREVRTGRAAQVMDPDVG